MDRDRPHVTCLILYQPDMCQCSPRWPDLREDRFPEGGFPSPLPLEVSPQGK